MLATVEHLMNCGVQVVYGYAQSDEISLLFHPAEAAFGRKVRKYTSILAGEASGKFSVELGRPAAFDCRACDYFRWRQEDASRNALNAHCYWMLRKSGRSAALAGMSVTSTLRIKAYVAPWCPRVTNPAGVVRTKSRARRVLPK